MSNRCLNFIVTEKLLFKNLPGTRGPLHSGAPWTLPTLPTPLLRHCHGYGDSVSRGVPVYSSAFMGTHCTYPRRDGQAELTWVAGYITEIVYPFADGHRATDSNRQRQQLQPVQCCNFSFRCCSKLHRFPSL